MRRSNPLVLSLVLLALTGSPWTAPLRFAAQDVTPITNDEEFSELEQQLTKAKKEHDRDLAFDALLEASRESQVAASALASALEARWDRVIEQVLDAKLEKKFTKLLKQRAQLDEARQLALELIEDEERYFYPYLQPEVSAEKAAQYHKVQAEVSRRVADLQGIWTKSTQVKLSTTLKARLREIAWLREREQNASAPLLFPEETPEWLVWLAPDVEAYDLSHFALTRKEAQRLQQDREVAAYNERVWSQTKEPKRVKTEEDQKQLAAFPTEAEREQVRVTNDYRAMMGRGALSWDARLQTAAHHHSEYQTRTGEFGHYQKDEATRTPFQRMRLAGYTKGVSENCAKGYTDPFAALMGWTRSSGHHRNMIMKGHRQMASAMSGDVWTQNYGVGKVGEVAEGAAPQRDARERLGATPR